MPLRYVLFLATAVVIMIPVVVFGVWPRSQAYDNLLADVSQRHLLIARNLGRALERYDRDVKAAFRLIVRTTLHDAESVELRTLLTNLNFRHVCVADAVTGEVVFAAVPGSGMCPSTIPAERFAIFLKMAAADTAMFSEVLPAPDGTPMLYFVDRLGGLIAIGAITTDYFVELAAKVAFGERGHAAIVDRRGKLLAHPMAAWRREMRDVSAVPPVREMLAGRTGVATFYSPAMKGDMIAGYAAVPGPGWGVMVPQPLSELQQQAASVRRHALEVIVAGVAVAAFVSWLLSGFLTRRVQAVSSAARRMASGEASTRVSAPKRYDPAELSELAAAFNQMAASIEAASRSQGEALYRAEAASRAKTNFLANVSHELRTPLNAVLGFSEVIRSESLGPIGHAKYLEYCDDIHQSGRHLLSLIDDLIDMSKVEANLVDPNEEWHELCQLLRRSVKLVESRAAGRRIRIVSHVAEHALRVFGDDRMLVQVFANLLSNAAKFSPADGTVEIHAASGLLGDCEIVITDEGRGIPDAEIGRVFEPFWQSSAQANVNPDGVGLGLSIVRQLVRVHSGDVTVANRLDGGLQVTVTLPQSRLQRVAESVPE